MKLGRHHFTLYRGYVDGMTATELTKLARRCLGVDSHDARRPVRQIQDLLIAAARAADRPDLVELFRAGPRALAGTEADDIGSPPSLEDFQADFDPTGFYRVEELLEIYRERYPDGTESKGARRKNALRARLRDALEWLEDRVQATPAGTDRLANWVDADRAIRFANAGMFTFHDVMARAQSKTEWWTDVRGFGVGKAQRFEEWMRELGLEWHSPMPSPTDLPSRIATAYSSATWERDWAFVKDWLEEAQNTHTARAYAREARRWCIWLSVEQERCLSDADGSDCQAFQQFLSDLHDDTAPWTWKSGREEWVRSDRQRCTGDKWRPFVQRGSAGSRSDRYATVVLRALYTWLHGRGVVRENPWAGRVVPRRSITLPGAAS
jgi:hypothetical protein